ncbi:hypothetical protein [Halochromatium sp.]
MSLSSRLFAFFRPLALVVLLFAALFFVYFGLSPAIDLLPGGMDLLVGILLGLFILISIISTKGSHRRR